MELHKCTILYIYSLKCNLRSCDIFVWSSVKIIKTSDPIRKLAFGWVGLLMEFLKVVRA